MLHPPRPFFQRKKKRFECSQNECEDDGHATRKKSIISHYVCGQNWICKQAYYHYLNCISSSEMMTASSSSPSFKILSREWMTLIHLFLCSFTKENVPRKRSVFSSVCTCLSTLPACDMMDLPSWYRLSVGIVEVTNKLKTSHITFHMCWCSSNRWIGFISGIPRLLNKTAEIILQSSSNYKLTNLQLHF